MTPASPFQIDGPAVVEFSGGRTSAYMLRRILDEGLRPDVYVLFADTGKERQETYRFVLDVAFTWRVEIHWVCRPGYFDQLITDRRCLPNPAQRWCTQELKIRPMAEFMRARGFANWTMCVGLRADEPRRIAKAREREASNKDPWDIALPLADAGATVADVAAFWRAQPFDLELRPHEGNCDLCFLKHPRKRAAIARDRPDLWQWWIDQERRMGQTFRLDTPEYAHLLDQLDLFAAAPLSDEDHDLIECHCHD